MKTSISPTDYAEGLQFPHVPHVPDFHVRSILVPTDLELRHVKTVWVAAEVAKKWGAELNLLHVYHDPVSGPHNRPTTGTYPCEDYRAAKFNALQDLRHRVKEYYYPRCEAYFSEGHPPEEIARYARSLHADLLIISQDLHTPPLFTFSETPAIIRETGIPVLVLPS
jgi:nucleotide-binding universal stress UspA family protein